MQETEKWQQLCSVIRQKFEALQLPEVAYEELERRLQPGTPYTYAKGYAEGEGYFHVEAGDRGNYYEIGGKHNVRKTMEDF